VAGQRQRLRLLAPFHRFHIEEPDIPICADNVGGVRVQVLRGEGGNFGRAVALVAKIPLGDRRFRGINRLHMQFREGGL